MGRFLSIVRQPQDSRWKSLESARGAGRLENSHPKFCTRGATLVAPCEEPLPQRELRGASDVPAFLALSPGLLSNNEATALLLKCLKSRRIVGLPCAGHHFHEHSPLQPQGRVLCQGGRAGAHVGLWVTVTHTRSTLGTSWFCQLSKRLPNRTRGPV